MGSTHKKTAARVAKVSALIDGGLSQTAALEKVGMASDTYLKHKSSVSRASKRLAPYVETIETPMQSAPTPQGRVVCLIGGADEVLAILKGGLK